MLLLETNPNFELNFIMASFNRILTINWTKYTLLGTDQAWHESAAATRSFDTSVAQTAVAPLRLALVITAACRALVGSGWSSALHISFFATHGCLVEAFSLPWPALAACGWWAAARLVAASRRRALTAANALDDIDRQRLTGRIAAASNLASTAVGFVGTLTLLDAFGVALGTVWGMLGLSGVALSLGIKDYIADFIAGLGMLLKPTFRVGDTIRSGDVQGQVSIFADICSQADQIDPQMTVRTRVRPLLY